MDEYTANFVVWAGDVAQPEAYKLSTQMGAAGFPFFATTNQNGAQLLTYTNAQINLIAALGEYVVMQNAELFNEYLTPVADYAVDPVIGMLRGD